MEPEPRRFLIVSGYHDYRSKRRADLHFIADELAKRGEVFFLSLRYSYLTRYREDPRHDLWNRANRFERSGAVLCYLWRTPIHPFRLPGRLAMVERVLFGLFARYLPAAVTEKIAACNVALIESGASIIYVRLLRQLNPAMTMIYMASDSLETINQANYIKDALAASAPYFDRARVPSPYLQDELPAGLPAYYIPHGIDTQQFDQIGPSPYRPGTLNAVSVGSMLFDPGFFAIAAEQFPDITFHVIGSGHDDASRHNVIYYPEMPFDQTLPYIKHASFAIAPYQQGAPNYLTHTSMKLSQYGYLGVPAVCPADMVGTHGGRSGYSQGDAASIRQAVRHALDQPARQVPCLSWGDVTERLLDPQTFAETRLPA